MTDAIGAGAAGVDRPAVGAEVALPRGLRAAGKDEPCMMRGDSHSSAFARTCRRPTFLRAVDSRH